MKLEKTFGNNVRKWRKMRDLSQETLAEKAQLHPTYVSGVESGNRNPTIKVVDRIAKALDVEPGQLFEEVAE